MFLIYVAHVHDSLLQKKIRSKKANYILAENVLEGEAENAAI
jgi:hypothetical protein